MKTCRYLIPALFLLLPACQDMDIPDPGGPVLVEHTLYTKEADELRTSLDPENDKKILWSPRECISILSQGGNYQFRGNNDATAASTSFTGTGPEDLGAYIALYPYDGSARVDGNYVSTTLPINQDGRAGSFADGCLITADDATGNILSFNHICSGIRFMFSRGDVRTVSIRGNSGEKIAGAFRFRFTAEDSPVADAGEEEVVTLTPEGVYFETGKYYYIVVLPTVFSKGFTLTAEGDAGLGTFRFDTPVTFSCGSFKNISGNLDQRMSWETSSDEVYYGPQNSFCLRSGETLSFDVSARLISSGWQRSGLPAASSPVPTGAEVLWGDSVASAVLSDRTLTVRASDTPGSSLVALKRNDLVLWSYLIWVGGSAPAETTLSNGTVILPALGGNCYFQWGRKDPLRPSCALLPHPGDAYSLNTSIRNPDAFIDQGAACADWYAAESYSHQDGTLWGGSGGPKTVWDPCPAGWRVPLEADFIGLTEADAATFEKLGILVDNGNTAAPNADYGWDSWCWLRETSDSFAASLRMETDSFGFKEFGIYGNARYLGLSVRCVKE